MKRHLFYGTILVAVVTGLSLAAPQPAIVQRPGQWTLEIRYEHPQQLVLPWGVTGETRFWYMILTVTNRTGQDVEFYPKCDLMTDTFDIVPAGRGVPPMVFDQIRARHQSQYPFLEWLPRVPNRMLEGEDNARDIAVIWEDFDPQATAFEVFIGGLSNETAVVNHPVLHDPATGQPIPVYLRKTLELIYAFRGDPSIRPLVEVVYQDHKWVMR